MDEIVKILQNPAWEGAASLVTLGSCLISLVTFFLWRNSSPSHPARKNSPSVTTGAHGPTSGDKAIDGCLRGCLGYHFNLAGLGLSAALSVTSFSALAQFGSTSPAYKQFLDAMRQPMSQEPSGTPLAHVPGGEALACGGAFLYVLILILVPVVGTACSIKFGVFRTLVGHALAGAIFAGCVGATVLATHSSFSALVGPLAAGAALGFFTTAALLKLLRWAAVVFMSLEWE